MNKKYLVLSLDGGGVRCALQIVLLKRICSRFPELEKRIKLIAGTSAGALVGAAVGALGVEKMIEHMSTQSFAKKIFTETWTHEVRSMRGLYRSNYTNKELEKLLISVFGSSTALNHYCLKSSAAPNLLITSFCIDTTVESSGCSKCKPVVAQTNTQNMEFELKDMSGVQIKHDEAEDANFKELDSTPAPITTTTDAAAKKESSRWSSLLSGLSLYNRWSSTGACSVSSSESNTAQTTRNAIIQEAYNQQKQHQNPQHKCNCVAWHAQLYHTFDGCGGDVSFVDALLRSTAAPTYFPSHHSCVDGGVIAQNPSLFAITHALRYAKHDDGSAVALGDIVVLSLGTGSHPMNMNTYGEKADLGLAQWVPNLMYLFNDASLDAADINCRYLLKDQYLRVQIRIPRAVDLANYNEWSDLVQWAEQEPLDGLFQQIQTLFFPTK